MLILALQKSGRLNKQSVQLLKDCGISFANGGNNPLKVTATNFPLQILYLRDDDIPECIADGAADCGIVGENIIAEKNIKLKTKKKLGFAKCRMSIAFPKQMDYNSVKDLNGLSIATSYPGILQTFLDKNNLNSSIHEISGSVEIAPGIGMADCIFDIVSTGSTLLGNGLKEVETVLKSEAVLVSNPKLDSKKEKILKRLLFRISAVKKAASHKYILLNTPNEKINQISALLPGMKSPTIMPLAEKGWSSLHSVINEDDFWQNIEMLKEAGAVNILIIPIEKMIA
ncbi:MAG: ATP phosphoribosyltransferase [Calditrichaeota bacterium]|nr:MAG: ATP phosphoribosyltransferase [Calditrichota bacterium]MBL1205621.1 ATP phosphoribosyltransferase [Calditrichota bacterium]NOG45449.1 ATP phosphoribosyltransferase [Calditrichota bacterium]